MIRHGPVTVDLRTRKVTVDGAEVALTPKEFDILECLAADPGRVLTRQEILEHAWDANWYGPTKVLDVHVAALRRKLGVPGLIETVYGRGLPARRRVMARRIALTVLALITALLAIVAVPLGLLTAAQDRADFRARAAAGAALATVAEERLPTTARRLARSSACAGQGDRVAVYDAAGHWLAGTHAGAPCAAAARPPGTSGAVLRQLRWLRRTGWWCWRLSSPTSGRRHRARWCFPLHRRAGRTGCVLWVLLAAIAAAGLVAGRRRRRAGPLGGPAACGAGRGRPAAGRRRPGHPVAARPGPPEVRRLAGTSTPWRGAWRHWCTATGR